MAVGKKGTREMKAYDSIVKFGKAQLNTNQNSEELICFYPHLLKKGIEYTQFNTQVHQFKTLTDEEMRKVINENVENVTVAEMVMFLTVCKAILRKAQE